MITFPKVHLLFSYRRSRADLVISITVLLLLLLPLVLVLEPLPLLLELSLFLTFRLSGDFSLRGTISFGALCPSRNFALWGLYPLGHFPLWDLCPFGLLDSFLIAGSLFTEKIKKVGKKSLFSIQFAENIFSEKWLYVSRIAKLHLGSSSDPRGSDGFRVQPQISSSRKNC